MSWKFPSAILNHTASYLTPGHFFGAFILQNMQLKNFFLSLLSCDTKFLQVSNSKDIFFKDLGAVSLKCNVPELHFLPSVYLREKTPKTSLRIPYQGDRTTPQAHIHIYHCPELSPRLFRGLISILLFLKHNWVNSVFTDAILLNQVSQVYLSLSALIYFHTPIHI